MKLKSLLLVVSFTPAMAMDKHSVTGTKPPQQVGDAVPGPKPPAPVTIKPSPPPNQQPKNNVGGPQGVQGPQQQAGGVKNQPNNLLSSGEKPIAINPQSKPVTAPQQQPQVGKVNPTQDLEASAPQKQSQPAQKPPAPKQQVGGVAENAAPLN